MAIFLLITNIFLGLQHESKKLKKDEKLKKATWKKWREKFGPLSEKNNANCDQSIIPPTHVICGIRRSNRIISIMRFILTDRASETIRISSNLWVNASRRISRNSGRNAGPDCRYRRTSSGRYHHRRYNSRFFLTASRSCNTVKHHTSFRFTSY